MGFIYCNTFISNYFPAEIPQFIGNRLPICRIRLTFIAQMIYRLRGEAAGILRNS